MYLQRDTHTLACKLGLFTSEAAFLKEQKRLGIPLHEYESWPRPSRAAVVYYNHLKDGDLAVVIVGDTSALDGIQIAAMLAHEATHVWQYHCDLIGERNPFASREFSAYGIQHVLQRLLNAYAKQKGLVK